MLRNVLKRKPRVVFMYAERYKHSGSTIMRGEQLAQIFRDAHSRHYKIIYTHLSTHHKNSVIILTKGAVTDITVEQILLLRKQGNEVLLDPVDNPIVTGKADVATGIIAASLEAHDAYAKMGYQSFLINHHVDTRLVRRSTPAEEGLRCGYFGELVNTVVTEKISKSVDFIHIDTGQQTNDWFEKPSRYNLHYAVRANNVEAYKPFLKGFTAAACSANIIIQRDQIEAVRWLGSDYPYLLNENPSENEILELLESIESDYGSDTWNRGLDAMKRINELVSNQAIASQCADVVASVRNTNDTTRQTD